MNIARLTGVAIAAATIAAGCMPYARDYTFLDGAGIGHEAEACSAGPPVWAVMAAGKASVKFALDPGASSRTKLPMLRVTAPRGTRVEIAEQVAGIESGGRRTSVAIRSFSPSANYPDTPDAQRARIAAEALRSRSGNDFYWYEFAERPAMEATGHVQLPTFIIDGERFDLPRLSFDRRGYVGHLPVNC